MLSATVAQGADFVHDIAPIVYRSCAPCHHAGGAGPFPLTSYADVKKRAGQIAAVTRSRYMPPWLPEHGYDDFEGERRLSDEQLRTIADWVKAGAPEGPVAAIPPHPRFPGGWQLGKPDLVLTAPAAFDLVDRFGISHLKEVAPGKGFPGMDLEVMRSPFDPPGNS